MATCKDCIHEKVCDSLIKSGCPWLEVEYPADKFCMYFKNKADVVEVVRCHNCEYHGIIDRCPLLNMSPYRDDERGYCSEGKGLE